MYRIIWTLYGKPYIAYDLHLNDNRSELCYYSPMTHANESIDISKVYRIEAVENGKYTAQVSDRIPTPAADNIIDCEIKTYLALSWSKNSNFVLYLPTFLDVCTKSDLNRVLTMIKQFSGAVMDDINKLLFTLETVLTSAARKYSKIKEWILNSKIYQEFFGSAEAEQLAAGDNMSLYDLHDTYTNYPTIKKSVYYTYSSDIPIISGEYCQGYVIEKICNVFAGVIKSCILTHCYDFTSIENLTNYVMYMLSKSGKVQFEYRIVSFPESIPDTMDPDDISSIRDFIFKNTVINIRKPKKATGFDIDVIAAEIKQFWNDRKEKAEAAPAADTAANTAPVAADTAPAENVVEPSEAVTPAADTAQDMPAQDPAAADIPPAENVVEPSEATAAAADNEYYYLGDYIINIPYLMSIYANSSDIDISYTDKIKLLSAADDIIDHLDNIPILSDFWAALVKYRRDYFSSDNELVYLMLAFKEIGIFDYIINIIQSADMPAQDPADVSTAAAPAADTAAPAAPDVSIVYMPPLFGICSYYADTGHLNGLLLIQYVIPLAAFMSAHGRPCCRYPASDMPADMSTAAQDIPPRIPPADVIGRYLASWTRSRLSLQGDRPEGYRPPGIPPHIKLYPAVENIRPRPPNIKNLICFLIPF